MAFKELVRRKCIRFQIFKWRKKLNKKKALEYFDEFYSLIYGKQWRSIRAALLTDHKYIAVVNNFGDPKNVINRFERDRAVNVRDIYEAAVNRGSQCIENSSTTNVRLQQIGSAVLEYTQRLRTNEREQTNIPHASDHYKRYDSPIDYPLNIEVEREFTYPPCLQLYIYPRGNLSTFPLPECTQSATLSHFLINGGSIFPLLMLNLQPGEKVFDACAAPGGKSLMLMQTLIPMTIVSNDNRKERTGRQKGFFRSYVEDLERDDRTHNVVITEQDARYCTEYESYDKVNVFSHPIYWE